LIKWINFSYCTFCADFQWLLQPQIVLATPLAKARREWRSIKEWRWWSCNRGGIWNGSRLPDRRVLALLLL